MARKPRPPAQPAGSLVQRAWALVKRHPIKIIASIVVFFGAVPAAVAGYSIVASFVEPGLPAVHGWVRDQLAPVLTVQNTQATAIDRFLLYNLQRDRAAAQADPAARSSQIVQDHIKELDKQIGDTQARINKAGAR